MQGNARRVMQVAVVGRVLRVGGWEIAPHPETPVLSRSLGSRFMNHLPMLRVSVQRVRDRPTGSRRLASGSRRRIKAGATWPGSRGHWTSRSPTTSDLGMPGRRVDARSSKPARSAPLAERVRCVRALAPGCRTDARRTRCLRGPSAAELRCTTGHADCTGSVA